MVGQAEELEGKVRQTEFVAKLHDALRKRRLVLRKCLQYRCTLYRQYMSDSGLGTAGGDAGVDKMVGSML